MAKNMTFAGILCLAWLSCGWPASLPAQETPAATPRGSAENATDLDELVLSQSRVADKYTKLEELLVRMAELEADSNPQRAALLMKAAKQSSERRTRNQLNGIVTLLGQQQLKKAADGQQAIGGDLKALLDLLLSENRSNRIKNEQARIREYIKEVERQLRLQRSLQGRTEGGNNPNELAQEQGKLADRAAGLAEEMRRNEEPEPPSESQSDGKPDGESKPSGDTDRKPGDGQPKDGQPKDGQPKDGQPKDGQPKDGQPKDGQPKDGQPQPGQPQDGQPQDGEAPSPSEAKPEKAGEYPAKKRIAAAEERMRAAQKRLEAAERDQALAEQEAAKEELIKAKAALEEILRQMREEEIERTLAMLEGRFRRMLESQLRIQDATKRLDKQPAEQRDREYLIQANRLSFDEGRLVVEADKALQLLQEDASSVAFPESVGQLRDDMQQVTDRLAAAKTDAITQEIEAEIVAALEEMIAALQQAQQDAQERKQNSQGPQKPAAPQDPSLVDQIAELKMVRALQMRVNTRTSRFAQMLTDQDDPIGQANEAELTEALLQLGEREKRIRELTRDIVLRKNQ